jgi:hypothetical protein
VNVEGLVSIVHDPNLDINTYLASIDWELHTIWQPVNSENMNFFKVQWAGGTDYPSTANQCGNGACTILGSECLCDIRVQNSRVFTSMPSVDDVLSRLAIGQFSPDTFSDGSFTLKLTENGVSLYQMTGKSLYSKHTVFGVEYRGKMTYFKNMESFVQINGDTGGVTYEFRNPPTFLNVAKPGTRDAVYETEAVLDHYFYHPNTAPFLASRLIKRFGISNPSYRYIQTVATAFTTGMYTQSDIQFGDGTYGNLESMIAAIILDREARSVTLDADPSTGSLREPFLKLTSFMRGMEYRRSENVTSLMMQGLQDLIGQGIHEIPNVFSFFLPDFAPPGRVAEAGLTAPEAQLLDSPKIIGFLNGLFSLVDIGMSNCYGGFGDRVTWWCPGKWNNKVILYCFFIRLEYLHNPLLCATSLKGYTTNSPENMKSRGFLTYAPTSSANAADVVDELALILTGGRLNQETRTMLINAYNDELGLNGEASALKHLQKLFLVIPEFHSTNVFESIGAGRVEAPRPEPSTIKYKAIVYLNLEGGLDSYNFLVPHSNCEGDTGKNIKELLLTPSDY